MEYSHRPGSQSRPFYIVVMSGGCGTIEGCLTPEGMDLEPFICLYEEGWFGQPKFSTL